VGQAVIGYAVLMIELFILLAAAVSIETALWTFGVVHAGCALGTWACVWWEKRKREVARMRRGELSTTSHM